MGEAPAVPLTTCQSALEESFVWIAKDTAPNLPKPVELFVRVSQTWNRVCRINSLDLLNIVISTFLCNY